MKVIFITREGYRLSGARVRCYHFAGELEKHGIRTEVLSFADHLGAKDGEEELAMPFVKKIKYSVIALRRLLKKEKDAVFFVQRLNYHAFAPILAALIRGQKLVFDCDDWNIREDPRYYLGFFPSSKMEFFTRKLAARADLCVAASHYLKGYLSPYARRVLYLPTGVDMETFKPRSVHDKGKKAVVLGWMGTVYHEDMYSNLKVVLDLFSSLAQENDRVVLRMAGEGRFFKKLKAEVGLNRFKDRIVMDDWVSPTDMPRYLGEIDIGLLPLFQKTRFNQAKSPTKLFEYMACAIPAVVSSVGEARYIIKDNDNGFLADDTEEFLKKLKVLVDDVGLRRAVGLRARQDAEKNYSLAVLGERLSGALSQISQVSS